MEKKGTEPKPFCVLSLLLNARYLVSSETIRRKTRQFFMVAMFFFIYSKDMIEEGIHGTE
jgi:hypothetical protein